MEILQWLYELVSYLTAGFMTIGAFLVGTAVVITLPLYLVAPFALIAHIGEPFWKGR